MQSALLDHPDAGFANIWKVGCDIERDLNDMKQLAELRLDVIRQLEAEKEESNNRIKRLDEWKESALEVEREWDANAVATMLGAKLGESQRKVIQREVPLLLERIKRLEEAGDAVDARLGCGCMFCGPCRDCQCASENWDEAKEAKP
jgi:hypothetical protein